MEAASRTVLQPVLQLEAPSVSLSATAATAAAATASVSTGIGGDTMLSLPNGSLGLPAGLNFVVGAGAGASAAAGAVAQLASSNDNNNNMDNASDDSNPVTIYR